MLSPGGVVLVSCYELGHQPLNLAAPCSALIQAGFEPRAIDTAVQRMNDDDLREAALIAFSTPMHTALRLAVPLARRARQVNRKAHITFYGLYAWLNAELLFQAGLADSVIGGEVEQPLVHLARSIAGSGHPAPGVRYADRYAAPVIARGWSEPSRAGLPSLDRYARLVRDGQSYLTGYVEATHGCKHTCSHCPITPVYNGRFLALPREAVLADIRAQVKAGARHITFGDPDFFNGPSHSLRIARAMHREFPEVTFDATIKIEHILRHRDLLPELRELGCVFVVSAVESLSDRVLTRLRKGHCAADVDQALDVMREVGIALRPTFVPFTPWTQLDDYLRMLHYVQEQQLVDAIDPVQYAIRLLIPPGSPLAAEPDAVEWLGELDRAAFTHRWVHPDVRMDALHAEVGAIVEQGELEQRRVWQTFVCISQAAHRASGMEPCALPVPEPGRPDPPRLSESWFC